MVGFFYSKPSDYIAALSSFGSILPLPSVSKRLNASLISSISSSDNPGLSTGFLPYLFYYGFFYILNDWFIKEKKQFFNKFFEFF